MIRYLLSRLAVTLAFSVGAVVMAIILDSSSVQAYLGMAAMPAEDLFRIGLAYVGIAALAGLAVDGLRLIATKWWHRSHSSRYELGDLFRDSLA